MKIGIIGGSGLEDPALIENFQEITVETPYGQPSSPIVTGKINGIDVAVLSRHGREHKITPAHVNNRANIYALAKEGCTHIISTTAVGSLREEIARGDFVILDQFIDFTKQRQTTFYEDFNKGIKHTSMADPFSEELRKKLIDSAHELGLKFHPFGTVVTIEGPRFSTRAESNMFRALGADVVNMSIAPEAILANEAGLQYAGVAMSTDYDCWKIDEEPVTWQEISRIMEMNAETVKRLIQRTIENIASDDENYVKHKIRTIPNFPKQGIMFRDITTLLKDADGFKRVIKILERRYKETKIDVIAGIESRGFIIAGALANKLNIGFVPLRKPGKLPAEVEKQEYELEYGKDTIEIHKDAIQRGQKVLLVDDLLATGGTARAACMLLKKLGADIVECCFIVELPELKGREKLEKEGVDVFSIVSFEGE